MAALHIKKGDNVVVLSGDDKGVIGEVLAVSPEEGKVIVKGVNIIHKHVKPRRQGESGGIVDAEGAIYASNVALICPQCGNPVEVFSIDTEVTCDRCGFVIYNDTLSCVQWCKYARQCVGDEMYERMMRLLEQQKKKRAEQAETPAE